MREYEGGPQRDLLSFNLPFISDTEEELDRTMRTARE